MTRKRIVTFLLALFLVLLCALGVYLRPALSAYDACRAMMENIEGYEVWRFQTMRPLNATDESQIVVTFHDGFNAAGCVVQRYGPLWVVTDIGQTLVGCSRGLTMGANCPRGKFGVAP